MPRPHHDLNELSDGLHLHFFHDTAAMDLNGFFAGAQLGGGLLVKQSTEEALEDLRFTASESIKPRAYLSQFVAFLLRMTLLKHGFMNDFQQIVVVERCDQQIERAGLHDFDASGNTRVG